MITSTLDPEEIYRQYLAQRQHARKRANALPEQGLVQQDNASYLDPQHVYSEYRRIRSEPRGNSVDAIMELIDKERCASASTSQADSINDQKHNSDKLKIKEVPKTSISKTLDALRDRLIRISEGMLVPAATALVLALLTISYFTNWQSPKPLLPPSLNAQAMNAAIYIETRNSENFSFASSDEEYKSHFNLGTALTNVAIAAKARNIIVYDQISQSLLTLLDDPTRADISSKLADLREAASDFDEGAFDKRQLLQQIDPIKDRLISNTTTVNTQWFDLGMSVQAVYLAAQLRLDSGVSEPFRDTLTQFRLQDIATEPVPASRLINQLRLAASASVTDIVEIRQIAALCRDIKILMN